MLATYLNQIVVYETTNTVDKYGDITYNNPVLVSCRREPCTKMIQDVNGKLYQTTHMYFIDAISGIVPEPWKNKFDGRVVMQVQGLVTIGGVVTGYEVIV